VAVETTPFAASPVSQLHGKYTSNLSVVVVEVVPLSNLIVTEYGPFLLFKSVEGVPPLVITARA
jgi:hypothetical protein